MIQELVEAVREQRAILFVGAGVSHNLGLPTYEGLIQHLARELEYDPDIYSTHGDHLALAEYYLLERGSVGPLRSWMDKAWHSSTKLEESEIHRLIVELGFPIIYTTNYDNWLESAHTLHGRKHAKIVNVGDLGRLDPDAVQIVKFHGDFSDDSSIVLTESDYFDRLDFETPLDIKLRHDLLGMTVLFIGYSLSDINIRYMLFRLNRQWESGTQDGKSRPKSFIFLTRPNPVQERILANRGVQAIVSEEDDPESGLREFLQDLLREAYGRA